MPRIFFHQFVGVFAARHGQHADVDLQLARIAHQPVRIKDRRGFAIERLARHVQSAQHGIDARRVGIERQDDPGREFLQLLELMSVSAVPSEATTL